MNLEFISTSLRPICEGCLCVDRKLSPVYDAEIRRFFKELVEPLVCYSDIDHMNHPSVLCWECTAVIKRTLRYKKQVQYAHGHLVQYMLRHTLTPATLSPLTVQTNPTETIRPDDETVFNSRTQHENTRVKTNSDSEELLKIELIHVKVEERDDYGDADGIYGDEDVDEKDFETVLKSDSETHEIKTKLTLKESQADSEEFGDSDNEPLKKRTEDRTGKSRGKRKKKDTSDGPKRKKSKSKREKPSGVVQHPRVARKLDQLNVPRGAVEMIVLSWEEVEAERQKALQSASFTRHVYRCDACAVGFNHRFKLDNHMKKHDPAVGAAVCDACGTYCRDARALAAHRRRHRVRWRCTVCGELGSRAAVAADHYARAHGAAPTHTCRVCRHTAPTLGKLRNHMKNHSERPKCDLCGKSFIDKASLRTHLFIHKGEKEYACARCGKQFLFKKAMQLHELTHDAPAHLYCHQCDVTFKNKITYYQHMKYNLKHIDPAKLKHGCDACGKRFLKAARLLEHVTAVHRKETPVACTVHDCRFACSSRTVLRAHIRKVHRNQRDVKNHVCHTCGKAYKTKTSLEGHMRAHSGERPFACAACAATFAYEAALYNHNKLVHLKAKKNTSKQSSVDIGTRRRSSAGPDVPQAAPDFPSINIKLANIYNSQV